MTNFETQVSNPATMKRIRSVTHIEVRKPLLYIRFQCNVNREAIRVSDGIMYERICCNPLVFVQPSRLEDSPEDNNGTEQVCDEHVGSRAPYTLWMIQLKYCANRPASIVSSTPLRPADRQ